MKFEKWHGIGNDFVMIENWEKKISLTPEQIQFLCDRHFGIGADAVILFEKSEVADAKMNYWNAGNVCGNLCLYFPHSYGQV